MILIPMAGQSIRFKNAGYSMPKFMLTAHDRTVFEWSLISFKHYFETELFIFIILKDLEIEKFLLKMLHKLGVINYEVVKVDPTEGQAHTVYLGLKESKLLPVNSPILIFNIDTFRWNFQLPNFQILGDGYLEVFIGEGSNWSYVKPWSKNSIKVIEVAEKRAISNLCCTGIYYFSNSSDFINAFEEDLFKSVELLNLKERYVAPLYNHLINIGKKVHYNLIDRNEAIFCGIPDEYEIFKNCNMNRFT